MIDQVNELEGGESERFLYKTRGVITDSEFSFLLLSILCRLLQSRDFPLEHRHETMEWNEIVGPTSPRKTEPKYTEHIEREGMNERDKESVAVKEEKSETAINNPLLSTALIEEHFKFESTNDFQIPYLCLSLSLSFSRFLPDYLHEFHQFHRN